MNGDCEKTEGHLLESWKLAEKTASRISCTRFFFLFEDVCRFIPI
jgi:hypothetical protein